MGEGIWEYRLDSCEVTQERNIERTLMRCRGQVTTQTGQIIDMDNNVCLGLSVMWSIKVTAEQMIP